jgi:hypothetical protein
MKPLHWILVVFAISCGGLQTTEAECEKGFERADDGACYPSGGGGLSSGDDGLDADGDDGLPTDDGGADDGGADGSDVDGDADGASPPDDGPPADEGPPDEGPSDEGPSDDGPSDDGPSDDGPADDGPADEGPSDEGDPGGESCTSDDDCEISDCPSGSIDCVCLTDAGFCVPSCSSDADCPDEFPFCEESLGVCGPDDL